jgi:hypothetical protein
MLLALFSCVVLFLRNVFALLLFVVSHILSLSLSLSHTHTHTHTQRYIMHSRKTAFIVEHDFIMATYLADKVLLFVLLLFVLLFVLLYSYLFLFVVVFVVRLHVCVLLCLFCFVVCCLHCF